MPWSLTDDVEIFAARAWDLLARSPAEQTIALSIVEALRGGYRWSGTPPLFASFSDGGPVRGAACMTPPFELVLTAVPGDAVAELVAALRAAEVDLPGVNGDVATVAAFAEAWTAGRQLRATTLFRQRLYALDALRPPQPPPPGRARPGAEGDLETAARWHSAFEAEAGVHRTDSERWARDRIGDGRVWLWEDDSGSAVSMAARTAPAAGVARVAPVYTSPEHRRHGYGAAVTAACTADALDRGIGDIVLFTDLANPTSNAIYQRIGYQPVSDRHVVRFELS